MVKMIITLILLCSVLYTEEPFDKKGLLGVNFYFDSFELSSFNRKFGIKHWSSNSIAFKAIIELKKISTKIEYSGRSVNDKESETRLFLSVGVEKHFNKNNKISPYSGIILTASLPSSKDEPGFPSIRSKRTISQTYVSFYLPIGIEYLIIKSISLSAQHTLGIAINKRTEKDTFNNEVDTKEISTNEIGFGEFNIILSIYFNL